MTYTAMAAALRHCRGTRKDGQRCRAWAVWDDTRQLCVNHAGRHRRAPYGGPAKSERTHAPGCTCIAYPFPHRPGGGLCRWPDVPEFRLVNVPRRRQAWELPSLIRNL